MVGKPKSDVPDRSRPQGLELSEVVGMCLSFLWFYRGVFLAGLLLYGLYYSLTMAKDKVAENKRRDSEAPAFVYVPRPVENAPEPEVASDWQPVPLNATPQVRQPEKNRVAAAQDSKSLRFQQFMATAEVDSLFRRFTTMMQEVSAVDPIEAVSNIRKCQQICDRLRQNDLTAERQERLLTMQLESVSQLDAINIQHDMRMPGVRDQLVVASTNLLQHPSVAVSAKAHLAVFAAHAMDLMFTPTRDELGALIDVYNVHVDGVSQGETETIVVANLLQKIVDTHQFDEVVALRRDLTNRMLSDGAMDLEKMNRSLREQVIFGDLGLNTLLSRLDAMSDTATQDVSLFYDRLERFPDARKEVFLIALAVVDLHLGRDQFDKASDLLVDLQRIQSRISDVETKDWFGELLTKHDEQMNQPQLAQ